MLVQKITDDILPVQLWNFFPDFRGTNIILPLTALLFCNYTYKVRSRGVLLVILEVIPWFRFKYDGFDFRKNKNWHKNDIADYASALFDRDLCP
jgi:hypothetical protein